MVRPMSERYGSFISNDFPWSLFHQVYCIMMYLRQIRGLFSFHLYHDRVLVEVSVVLGKSIFKLNPTHRYIHVY